MSDSLVEYLRFCCLRVLGKTKGCGFFIAPQLVVTCSHVVGRDVKNGTQIELEQWKEGKIHCMSGSIVFKNFPDEDIALIQTPVISSVYAQGCFKLYAEKLG